MAQRTLKGRVAIVGIGETHYYKHGQSPDAEFKLALQAVLRACADAGLDPRHIDGFASYGDDRSEATRLASALGLPRLRSATMQWGGGGGGCCAAVANGAAAIATGQADCVVVFRSLNQGQYGRFGQSAGSGTISGERAYLVPYGVISPPQRFAMRIQRYMHEHGIRQEALRAIALASYHHAQANPRAVMHGKPLDAEKYDASRWIAEPLHLFDCCMENDGAAAIVMVDAERAADFAHKPVYLLGAASGSSHRFATHAHNSPSYASANFETVAEDLYRMAGLGPADVGVVQSYENFTGGVGHGEALRAELAPAGMSLPSLACDAVNGEGITAARSAGAGFERYAAGDFFWQPVSRVPRPGGPGLFPHLFLDRAKPGLVAVDAQGRRFADEAGSYHHFVEAMVRHLQRTGGDAAWLVCDAAFVHKYGLGVILPGTRRLDRWIRQGYVCVADRLPALAQRAGIDPAGLLATVQRTNDYAATGRDPDFHKGDAPVDRFNGDPAHRPNPCLGEIGQPPFVALRILPADAASSSGLPIDADGRVLDRAGRVVVGLYACGNDAASVMRGTYPGPGTTLGPAFVFAWRAALFAARRAASARAHPIEEKP